MAAPFTSESASERVLWTLGPTRMEYDKAWRLQRIALEARLAGAVPDILMFVEHPPVYTVGRRGTDSHILVSDAYLKSLGAEVFHVDRGGDVTFHGPGQLVGYPILDLSQHRKDIHWYLRSLETTLIRALDYFGIPAKRIPGLTGVWVGDEKIAAIGIKVSRWVTMHGFALNVTTDLKYFDYIVPCGIRDKRVTSIEKLTGQRIPLSQVSEVYLRAFEKVFAFDRSVRINLRQLDGVLNRRAGSESRQRVRHE